MCEHIVMIKLANICWLLFLRMYAKWWLDTGWKSVFCDLTIQTSFLPKLAKTIFFILTWYSDSKCKEEGKDQELQYHLLYL